ncbi:NAD-dependent epimerase/dehydratase family protein [Microvirga sp. 2YAF29]|uniref:NAD-dependent epimerase/dehydratase family protein n=1 Tax=Microvirga sp. 2YAF29 TaxID=3233031 RepID=UPI003F998A6A
MNFETALVTGGTGFIGTALSRRLTQSGIKTTVLARPGASTPPDCEVVSIPDLSRHAVTSALAGYRFDAVFHLAAYGVAPADRDPRLVFDVNVGGTDAIIHVAAETGAKSVVFLGSCSEYRDLVQGQLVEEDAPIGVSRLYGGSKAVAGVWGQALAAQLGVGFQWLRLFNVFGPGEGASRLIPALISRLKANETVALSPGEQVRDFLYIDDVVTGILLAAEASLRGQHGPFNLCSGKPITVKEIALAVADVMGKPYDLLGFGDLNYRPDDIHWLVGSPNRFHRATGFRPQMPLLTGIEQMIASEQTHCERN